VALRTCTVSVAEIQVREPATCYRLTMQQIRRWRDAIAVSPDETLKKRRLINCSLKRVRGEAALA
jgi:hypothetical protein